MSFQWIFDNASELSITKQPTVAQSITRNNRVSAVQRGGNTYRFTVSMPAGLPYQKYRSDIERVEALGRYTTDTVSIPQSYISGYSGDASSFITWDASVVNGESQLTIVDLNGANISLGETVLAAGDFVQIGTGNTYTVTESVTWPNTNTAVPLNRPVFEPTGNTTITGGVNATWDVICVAMPEWKIFDYNLVTWSGPFVFYEVLR